MPKSKNKRKKPKLLAHESALLDDEELSDVTHPNASSRWLYAASTDETTLDKARILIYRHMADKEFEHLMTHNQLPDTQPYQTITRSQDGRTYCESYLRSNKFVDTSPTTVVEFNCSKTMIDGFYDIQRKPEDGCLSHGLGHKAGKTLFVFNGALGEGDSTWRIVLVKRGFRG
ncbi:expressed unknown protein [Seminavis robusta]|uniref:Uncharacterized protein n=1 Tax=Seminavis robusta TaxID=568900 RepID=A0A9N8E846_9STRA|nr:expressed unknown protein [Seminavis robusta]|eukprot:Sro599_g173200.1 n/a (173) ;mRNA; f:16850-17368